MSSKQVILNIEYQEYQEATAKITENLDYDERCALLQEWPTFRAVQSRLYKKKYEFVPRDPENMKDFDADLSWCTLSSGENIVKGDILLENGKRIIMFSTNAPLDILACAIEILGDGTFKITPKLWHQVFVISVQVTSDVYVPIAVFLLPDKMGISYSAAFSLLKEALEKRGLSLAAKWFMSDFEPAIKIAFTEQFPLIKPKGCSFHFSKAIISKVQKSGFKADYTKKENFAFSAFIRAILGLVYCPLDRFKESIRNLYKLAKRLKVVRQRKFSLYMLNYVSRYWVNGCHHPEEWNMYLHSGQTTNNRSEGYNNRLSQFMGKHPNLYNFISVLKEEFQVAINDASTASVGRNPGRAAPNTKNARSIKTRQKMQENIKLGKTDLLTYQQAIGGSVIQSIGGVIGDDDYEEEDDMPEMSEKDDVEIVVPSLAEILVPLGLPDQINEREEGQLPPAEPIIEEARAYRHVRVQQKRKSQLSDSVGGNNLRLKRMRLEVDGGEIRPRPLNNELLDAEFEGQEIRKKDIFAFYNLDVKKDKLSLEQGQYIMERRLQELQFVLSPSQKSTPRDGNCLPESLFDQTQYVPELADVVVDAYELRVQVVLSLENSVKQGIFDWVGKM